MEKKDLHQQLERTTAELQMLYEIGIAMRTTLKLDQILFIILTGVTFHDGLGFNRAMLFLVNEHENTLEGKMGIGPDTGEEANKIWREIEKEKKTLDDLISAYDAWEEKASSRLNNLVKSIKIPLREDAGILALTALEGMAFEVTNEEVRAKVNDEIARILNTEYFVSVPLMAKDKVVGVIMADNRFTKKPITKDDIHVLTMFADHAGLAIENSRLYEQTVVVSNMDWLTHTWNHGYFQGVLAKELESALELKQSLSLIMIDIDDFKPYNDSLGHQAGDVVLKQLSQILKENSRAEDYVCRYGGEEFGIILPGKKKSEALVIAERLRKAVENHQFPNEDIQPNKSLTVSLGIASVPKDTKEKDELIYKADQAMFKAKHAGKNRICTY